MDPIMKCVMAWPASESIADVSKPLPRRHRMEHAARRIEILLVREVLDIEREGPRAELVGSHRIPARIARQEEQVCVVNRPCIDMERAAADLQGAHSAD